MVQRLPRVFRRLYFVAFERRRVIRRLAVDCFSAARVLDELGATPAADDLGRRAAERRRLKQDVVKLRLLNELHDGLDRVWRQTAAD